MTRDAEHLRALRFVRFSIIFFIWSLFAFVTVPIAIYTMPDIEAAWFPPLDKQTITDVHYREDDPYYLLENWTFRKRRKAVPEYMTFMAYRASDPRVRYAVDTYIGWDCKNVARSDRTSLPSEQLITKQICVRLPEALAGKPDVRIDGIFDFNVGHGLYTVPVKVPAGPDPSSILAAPSGR